MTIDEAKILLCQMYLPQFDEEEKQALTIAIQALEEIQTYRDAEEQGLLLRLPCKVGDTVWWLNGKFLMECEIESFVVDEDGISFAHIRYLHDKKHNRYYGHNLDIEKLGIIWFLTKEEAEHALKQMGE